MNTYNFYLPIGDWSNDGHGKCKKYLIESNINPIDLIDIYLELDSKCKISEICAEYEEYEITNEQIKLLENIGLNVNKYFDEDNAPIDHTRSIAELIIDGMMLCNENLKLRIIDNIPDFNTWLARENKKPYFGLPGYGLFS